MPLSVILLLVAASAFILPILFEEDDTEGNPDDGTIKGTPGPDDPLNGTTGDDLILGFKGDDVINGNGGEDELIGGGGMDTITGGADRDIIDGGADNDMLFGMGGNDTIEGDAGDDTIDAGSGNDIVRGGFGNDTIFSDSGTNTLRGEGDNDDVFLWGEGGTAFGGPGDDDLVMMTGRGTLDGVLDDNVYYSLANLGDEQQTVAIVAQFLVDADDGFSAQDEIVLTIDTDDATALGAPLAVTVTEGTLNGSSGYNIEVAFEDPNDEPANFETARVFVLGTSVDVQTIADAIKVEVTLNASLDTADAEQTLADVKAGAAGPSTLNVPTPPVPV